MTETDRDEIMLNALFDAARKDNRAEPSSNLLARVYADSEIMQPVEPKVGIERSVQRIGFWTAHRKSFISLYSAIGLSIAAVGGIWIGILGSTSLMQDGIAVSLLSAGQAGYLSEIDTSYAFLLE